MGKASGAPREEEVSFEKILERLRAIVEQLEDGELPLAKSLELFEEGIRLSRQGAGRLDAAEKRIEELLSNDDEDGNPKRAALESPGTSS